MASKTKNKLKERLIIVFVIAGVALASIDIGQNIRQEMKRSAQQEKTAVKPPEAQKIAEPTLSEEEMKRWAERLESHPDT